MTWPRINVCPVSSVKLMAYEYDPTRKYFDMTCSSHLDFPLLSFPSINTISAIDWIYYNQYSSWWWYLHPFGFRHWKNMA